MYWNVMSSKKSKIWKCPREQQVTAHCFLSNRKEKLFKFSISLSISWTDVVPTSKHMATHQWISCWSFWGQLIHWHQVILTECWRSSYIEMILKFYVCSKNHSKILNYINSLLDYWSVGIIRTIFQPPECTFSVDLEGCHFGEVHGPAIREVQLNSMDAREYNAKVKTNQTRCEGKRQGKSLFICLIIQVDQSLGS